MTESQWTETLRWAGLLAEQVDLDKDERDYKIRMADRLAEARELVLVEDPEWPESLRRALAIGNFINQFVMMALIEQLREHPHEIRELILDLWESDEHVPAIGRFVTGMRPRHSAFSPGNATTLASALLMAISPTEFPPYRTEAVHAFLDLVGLQRPDQSDPAVRYQSMLDALDELLARAESARVTLRDRLDAQGLAWTLVKASPPRAWDSRTRDEFRDWRGDKVAREIIGRGAGKSRIIEDAAWAVMGAGLRGDASVLDPSIRTWSAENARELGRRVNGGDQSSKAPFLVKLKNQLEGGPRGVILLAAELLYLQVLPLSNIKPATKQDRIAEVLRWTHPALGLPENLNEALAAEGVFNGGVGFNIQIWQQLLWMCRFVEQWDTAPAEDREAALTDPWAFRSLMASTPQDWASIRYSLQYLAWPGFFENVVKVDHRRAIQTAFAHVIGGATGVTDEDVDHDLFAARQRLEGETGHWIDWYEAPYVQQWLKDTTQGQRAWLVRQQTAMAPVLTRWTSEGIVSLPAKHLGEVPAGAPLSAVRQAVEAGYQHLDYAQRLSLATEYHSFLTKMQTEDIVATVAEGRLILGFILGDPEYLDDADTRLRRPVQWLQDASVALDALTPTLRALLDGQGAVVDLTAGLALLLPLAPLEIDDPDDVSIAIIEPPAAAADSVPALPRITQAFADSLHMPLDKLQEYAELLESRQQLVFYGPPGTGKTYVAKELADFAVGADNTSRVQLVQFHPSYSYEDFFEGFRPYETESGQASFRVTAGALRRLASEASKPENSSHPFILIIDEMNRANIAKVFGELYFLLEYRNSSVSLQYNPNEQFRLPKNLFIIGTMNTADRSIALVDAAIRRRFPFVELHPQLPPVEGVLRRYLEAKGYSPERGLLLAKLNADIEDRDMQIGPSYLMRKEASEPLGLARVWDYDILPLLTEHYYGRLSPEAVRSRFGLDSIRKNLGLDVEVALETESGPAAEPVGDDGVEPTA